jgi:hypothetical protein
MPRNVYFSHGTRSEKHLLEDIVIESISIHGHDVFYIPRKIIKNDRLLNEDMLSQFEKAFKIEMYLENVDGFEGDGKLISKFGLEIRDQVTLVVARRRWNQLIGRYGYTENSVRPREGDLIYFPMTRGLFEIKFVEDKLPFYQLNNVPTFKLTCEMFEYRHENITTGIYDIDSTQDSSSQPWRAEVSFEENNPHDVNEMITLELPSGVTGSAKFLSIEKVNEKYIVNFGALKFDDNEYHRLTVGTVTRGLESETVGVIEDIIDLDDDVNNLMSNLDAQNSTFEVEGNAIIDFDENNPFGEPY